MYIYLACIYSFSIKFNCIQCKLPSNCIKVTFNVTWRFEFESCYSLQEKRAQLFAAAGIVLQKRRKSCRGIYRHVETKISYIAYFSRGVWAQGMFRSSYCGGADTYWDAAAHCRLTLTLLCHFNEFLCCMSLISWYGHYSSIVVHRDLKEKFDKSVWLHSIRLTMLTLQLFALQHVQQTDCCNAHSCLSCETILTFYIILPFLAMWYSFASSYKHKKRCLQNRKTILSTLGWRFF